MAEWNTETFLVLTKNRFVRRKQFVLNAHHCPNGRQREQLKPPVLNGKKKKEKKEHYMYGIKNISYESKWTSTKIIYTGIHFHFTKTNEIRSLHYPLCIVQNQERKKHTQ